MTLPLDPAPDTAVPLFAALRAALAAERSAPGRRGLLLREVPAPRNLAPHALAVAAEALHDDTEVAHGRLVVLHDPEGQDGWYGQTRMVAFVSADVDPEMAQDAALAEAAWQWVGESLAARRAGYRAAGGTVTRTVSQRFGELRPVGSTVAGPTGRPATRSGETNPVGTTGMATGRAEANVGPNRAETSEVEIRASWTAVADPAGLLDLGAHLRGWCDLLAATAGLPPPGVGGRTR